MLESVNSFISLQLKHAHLSQLYSLYDFLLDVTDAYHFGKYIQGQAGL